MRKRRFVKLLFFLSFVVSGFFYSCIDEVSDQSFYTFTGETIFSYLEKDESGQFTELLKAVEKADLKGLLSSYGTFTFFVPTNDAFESYYKKNETSLEELTVKEIKDIIFYHLIETQQYAIADFGEGLIPSVNMKNRYLSVTLSSFQGGEKVILINQSVPIVIQDIETHNGTMHAISGILEPSDQFLNEILESKERYSIFVEALRITGLVDSVKLIEDENYVQQDRNGYDGVWPTAPALKYGYTAFVESDETFRKEGISDLNDLITKAREKYKELYGYEDPTGDDWKDRKNSLNMFVAYHLLEQISDASGLVDRYYKTRHTTDFGVNQHVEYIPTMRHRSLLEVKTGNYINQKSDGTAVMLVEDLTLINVSYINGIYHEIDKVLWYDKSVEQDVLNKRLRVDFGSLNPEFANNALRGTTVSKTCCANGYLKYTDLGDDPNVNLYVKHGNNDWCYYQGDGITVDGWYDITIQLPPLPPDTWEIRVGVICYVGSGNLAHGVAQLYFSGEPIGIPMDFGGSVYDPSIGWILDSQTDDNGSANDRAMRNRGWMKAPPVYGQPSSGTIARDWPQPLRRILTTVPISDRDKSNSFRAKALNSALLDIDYFEFVPKSALENEDIY